MSFLEEIANPLGALTEREGRRQEESARGIQEEQLGELRRQFDIGRARLEPTLTEAVPAFDLQAALAGALGPEAQQLALSGIAEAPGTAFEREQGLRLIESGAAASGGLGGGNRLRQLTQFGTDLARSGLSDQFSRLGIVSGAGQGATTETAGLGSRFAANVGQVTQQGAQNVINALQAQQQQRSSAAGTGAGLLAAFLSDENKKTDIRKLSSKECYDHVINTPIKAWRYLAECGIDTDMHIGPMAQEAPECIKVPGKEMLSLHDELWLIAGALQHFHEVNNG